jgi:sulfate permease, SulP family
VPTSTPLFGYPLGWLSSDLVAGITLAAYAIPVSLAYATLAGLAPQVGVYGYLMGGLGYALAGSSRYLAIGPTSAISLMIAGTVGAMASDNGARYAEIATAAAVGVGVFCLIAWAFRLSVLVKLISDSVLTGFKAGAGLTIAITQLPALLGVAGGGHNVPERLYILAGQLGATNLPTLALGVGALAMLWSGERWLPGRPVALGVVALSIIIVSLFELTRFKVMVTGVIPPGLPLPAMPTARLRDQEGILALAMGCMLLAYIEGVAAARAFATKHHQTIDPRRELLGLAAANVATAAVGGYPVAGGLSQTAVNEGAGARSRMSLVFASLTLALCLLFFTTLLANLSKAVLAAVVLMAVAGLVDFRAFAHMWKASRIDFLNALVALVGVLLLGDLQGILLAALISVLLLIALSSTPHVALPGTDSRHGTVLGPAASSGQRAADRHPRFPPGSFTDLSQRRACYGAGPRAGRYDRCEGHPERCVRSLRVSGDRPRRSTYAGRVVRKPAKSRHRADRHQCAWASARPATCRRAR